MGKNKRNFGNILITDIRKNWILYVMILPVVAYYIIFSYMPMYGITLAFKTYRIKLGIMNSPWVGFKNFERLFYSYIFWDLIKNTLGISVYSLIVGFPAPIIFALMLNYLKSQRFKKTVQMVSYAPYFISTVVICGMISIFMSQTGVFNVIRGLFGLEAVDFLSVPEWFKSIYVWSGGWQALGWSSIIYISALSGVDPEMHEAAIVDGASKIKRMIYIDIPSIKPTMIMLLILQMGSLLNVGFEKVYLLQNSLNLSASEVISTYTYKMGLIKSDYSFSTAVGLFNSVINLILLVGANLVCKKVAEESLF